MWSHRAWHFIRDAFLPGDLPQRARVQGLTASLLALTIGLALTGLTLSWQREEATQEARLNFDRHTEKLDSELNRRFGVVLHTLKDLRGYYHASAEPIRRQPFHVWVASRRIHEDMPGVRGIGFIQRVERDRLDEFLQAERHDSAPNFRIRTAGQAEDLYVIKFIEPLSKNEAAWGFDVGSEANRRHAAQRAVQTADASLTRRVVLVQDGRKGPGYLFFLPVYQWAKAQDTLESRQRHLVGLLYTPIVAEEFFAGIGDVADGLLDIELFDGNVETPAERIFSATARQASPEGTSALVNGGHGRFVSVRRLEVGGQTLLLKVSSTPMFEQRFDRRGGVWMGLAGVLLSSLLAATIWLLVVGRARAEALASRMTADLSAAKARAEHTVRENTILLDTLHRFNLMSMSDPKGRIIEVNDAFCKISGYTAEELIGQRHTVIGSDHHPAEFWAELWETVSAGQVWEGEICNRAKSGQLFWVKTMIVPLLNDGGKVERFLSVRSDITANKQAEKALSFITERYQLAIDGGSEGLWDWINVNDHKMWWSPQLFRMLGYEPDELHAGLDAFDNLLHPQQKHVMSQAIEAALRGDRAMDILCMLRTKCGQYRWFRCRGKVFFDDYGFATRMAGAMQDVHDRHLAEEVIQKHSEQLSAIFSLSPDGFVSFGADGQVNYASAAYTHLTGLAIENVLCLSDVEFLEQLLALCVNPPPLRCLDDLLQRGPHKDPISWLSRHRLVLELKEPAGRMLALSLYQAHGEAITRLLLVRDVTHEAEVDRMKSNFLSMAAHELRTPMASIYGFVELLLSRELKVEKQRDLLGKVYRQCEVMIAVVNELLDLSRIESQGGADFERLNIDMAAVVQEALSDFKAPTGRDAPHLEQPLRPVPVEADRKKLCQAFMNVVSNAYKYSPQGGSVRVSFPSRTGESGEAWCGVRVVDEGIGMSAEQLAHMGERFYRADKSGNIPGTGLGMSIVKEIMELMGGHMVVESELGRGTTITLWLPAKAPLLLT